MTRLFVTWIFVVAISVAAVNSPAGEPDDPVAASFERELNHEPAPRKETKREDIDSDELYKRVNEPLWTRTGDADQGDEE